MYVRTSFGGQASKTSRIILSRTDTHTLQTHTPFSAPSVPLCLAVDLCVQTLRVVVEARSFKGRKFSLLSLARLHLPGVSQVVVQLVGE